MSFETKKTQYSFLEKLEEGKEITQSDLSRNLEVSIGFMNALIKRFVKKGFVKASQVPYKRFVYYLTPNGFKEKSKLVAEYLDSSLQLFRTIRSEFNFLFRNEQNFHYVLYGLSEITEICIISALENNKEILSIIDDQSEKNFFLGIPVIKKIKKFNKKTKIILTKIDKSQHIYNSLINQFGSENIVVIKSLCISKKKPNFNPKKNK